MSPWTSSKCPEDSLCESFPAYNALARLHQIKLSKPFGFKDNISCENFFCSAPDLTEVGYSWMLPLDAYALLSTRWLNHFNPVLPSIAHQSNGSMIG